MSIKTSLKAAKEELSKKEYKAAVQHCKAALKIDSSSYDAYLLIGKAAFLLEEHGQSELAYTKATELDESLLPAWKGLVELHTAVNDNAKLLPALEHLHGLSGAESLERRVQLSGKLAEVYARVGRSKEAMSVLETTIGSSIGKLGAPQLPLLCQLADLQASSSEASPEKSFEVLQRITELSKPDAEHAKYHGAWLEIKVACLAPYSDSTEEWRQERTELLKHCMDLVVYPGQAEESPACRCWQVYETALQLNEQLAPPETLDGEGVEFMARSLAGFPEQPTGGATLAVLEHARLSSQESKTSTTAERRRLAEALGIEALVALGSGTAWRTAAHLHLQNGDQEACAATASRGLLWLQQQAAAGNPPQPEVKIGLELAQAGALLLSERYAEAETQFRRAAEASKRSSRGPQLRAEALLGMARCAVGRRDWKAAGTLCRHLAGQDSLSPGLRGRVLSEHGWVQMQTGQLEESRSLLEEAVASLMEAGGEATDSCLGEAHWRLGRAYWEAGGAFREDRAHTHKQWLTAATLEGPAQGAAFAWLGKFCAEVAADVARAQKCFQRALTLDATQKEAGKGLCGLLQRAGNGDKALELCQGVTKRSPGATWAWSLSGRLLLKAGQTSGVPHLSSAIAKLPE